MKIKGFRKYTMNPALGLLPIALFFALHFLSPDIRLAFSLSLVLTLLIDCYHRSLLRTSVFSLVTLTTLLGLVFGILFHAFFGRDDSNPFAILAMCEIGLVLFMSLFVKLKWQIAQRYFPRMHIQERTLLREIFSMLSLCGQLLTLHLLALLIYSFVGSPIENGWHSGWRAIHIVLYGVVPVAIILFVLMYESYMLRSFSTRFFKEEWLPIVDNCGRVIGKVAKSVSVSMKNQFLHPVVRIALVCDGKLYVQKRPADAVCEPCSLDHPFEKYILFKQNVEESADACVARMLGGAVLPLRFQLKYRFENPDTKRLVLFYVARVSSPAEITNLHLLKGKFWTINQLSGEAKSGIFSECFLRELEYLKQTVLNPALQEMVG